MKAQTNSRIPVVALGSLVLIATLLIVVRTATAHCQVPCGIYDDDARIKGMLEDAATIAKATIRLNELVDGDKSGQSVNQAVRWIKTKEEHASNIITTVSEYFLTQKVKPVSSESDAYNAYLNKLASHHAVMVAAMKTKQNADPALSEKLNAAIHNMARHYHSH